MSWYRTAHLSVEIKNGSRKGRFTFPLPAFLPSGIFQALFALSAPLLAAGAA